MKEVIDKRTLKLHW